MYLLPLWFMLTATSMAFEKLSCNRIEQIDCRNLGSMIIVGAGFIESRPITNLELLNMTG